MPDSRRPTTNDPCSVPHQMLVEQRIFLEPGQTITIYGEVASSGGRQPNSGMVVADAITIQAVEPASGFKWRRLSFRHLR